MTSVRLLITGSWVRSPPGSFFTSLGAKLVAARSRSPFGDFPPALVSLERSSCMTVHLIAVSCFLSLTLASSEQSLRALAEKHQTKVIENLRIEHFDPRTPEELVTIADTVLSGRILEATPHFTPDEREIVTDYRILVARVIKRDPNLDSAAQPGTTRALVIRRKGGTVVEADTGIRR